jgi:transcriptional regulator with XRE-family HTH domain
MPTPSVSRLRELRLGRGWTQQEVADRILQLAWDRKDRQVGVTADAIAKWERGAKGVSARYRELLASVFGVPVEELGLPGLARARVVLRSESLEIVEQVRVTTDLLVGEPSSMERKRLLRHRAGLAILAGRLLQDRRDTIAARGYYGLAIDDAYELGDEQLAARAHGMVARLVAAEGRTAAAARHLSAVARLISAGVPAEDRRWQWR